MLNNIHVWLLMKRKNRFNEKPVFTEFIRVWCEAFPEDKKEILEIFIKLTVGVTITHKIGEVYEKTAHAGVVGDYFSFTEMMNKRREFGYFRSLAEARKAGWDPEERIR